MIEIIKFNTETKYLIIASFFIAFAISFNEWGNETFNFFLGLFNLLKAFIISLFVLSISLYFQKKFAEEHGINIQYSLWFIQDVRKKEFGILTRTRFPSIPIGIILLLLSTFYGLYKSGIFFLAVGGFSILSINKNARLQRRFKTTSEREISQIALRGPFSLLVIAIISTLLIKVHPVFLETAKISAWLAIFNMLPFPNLDGSKMFFYERLQYVFWLVLIVLTASLILLTKTAIIPIIIAIIAALFITVYYGIKRFG